MSLKFVQGFDFTLYCLVQFYIMKLITKSYKYQLECYFHRRKKLLALMCLYIQQNYRRSPTNRVRPIFSNRIHQGEYCNLIEEMRLSDPIKYFNYFRMSGTQLEELLHLTGAALYVCDRFRLDVISPQERLCLTIR